MWDRDTMLKESQMKYTANIQISHALILLILPFGCTQRQPLGTLSLADSGTTLKIIYDDPSALKPHWVAGTTMRGLITDNRIGESFYLPVQEEDYEEALERDFSASPRLLVVLMVGDDCYCAKPRAEPEQNSTIVRLSDFKRISRMRMMLFRPARG